MRQGEEKSSMTLHAELQRKGRNKKEGGIEIGLPNGDLCHRLPAEKKNSRDTRITVQKNELIPLFSKSNGKTQNQKTTVGEFP